MGLRGLVLQEEILALFGMTADDISDNFILFTEILTDTAFIFLPALVAWSTFRVFGGTPIIGLVLGLMLVSPSLPNAWDVAGRPVSSRSCSPASFPSRLSGIRTAGLHRSVQSSTRWKGSYWM